MFIKVTKAPEGAKFDKDGKYRVFVTKNSAFVFDDESESFFITDLEFEEVNDGGR